MFVATDERTRYQISHGRVIRKWESVGHLCCLWLRMSVRDIRLVMGELSESGRVLVTYVNGWFRGGVLYYQE